MTEDADLTTDETDGSDVEQLSQRLDALEDAVSGLDERLADLERNVAWIARHQAAETGNGVCPNCNTGGALGVDRAPTGKKEVRCTSCGEQLR